MKLKQRGGGATRTLRYPLPVDLAVDGAKECYIEFRVKSAADCAVLTRAPYEALLAEFRADQKRLERALEDIPKTVKASDDDKRKYRDHAKADLASKQAFMRGVMHSIFDLCIESWATNLLDTDTGSELASTPESVDYLIGLSFPDGGMMQLPELTSAMDKLRDATAQNNDTAEIEAEDLGNSGPPSELFSSSGAATG